MNTKDYGFSYVVSVVIMTFLFFAQHPFINMALILVSFGTYLIILALPYILTSTGIRFIEKGKSAILFYISIVVYVIMFLVYCEWFNDPKNYADESGSTWSYQFDLRLVKTAFFLISMFLLLMYLKSLSEKGINKQYLIFTIGSLAAIFGIAVMATFQVKQTKTKEAIAIVTKTNKKEIKRVTEKFHWHYRGVRELTIEVADPKSFSYANADAAENMVDDPIKVTAINNIKLKNTDVGVYELLDDPGKAYTQKIARKLHIVGHKDLGYANGRIEVKVKKIPIDKFNRWN